MKYFPPTLVSDDSSISFELLEYRHLGETLRIRNIKDVRCRFLHNQVISTESHFAWYESYLHDPAQVMWVATFNSNIAAQFGIYDINLEQKSAQFGRIFVDPAYQQKGIGRVIVRSLIKSLSSFNLIEELWLDVIRTNSKAIKLYEYSGFQFEKFHVSNDVPMLRMNLQVK